MAERTIAAMFDTVPTDVDEGFISRLREFVVEELCNGSADAAHSTIGSGEETSVSVPIVGRPKPPAPDRRPAWLWIAAVAALIVSVLALTKLVSSLGTPTITVTPPATTTDPSAGHAYYQPITGELEVGATPIRYGGTVAVDSAAASGSDPAKAVVSADVTMTLTPDAAAGVVQLRTAYVELYFDNGTVSCVDAGAACSPGALIGSTPTADPSSISAPPVSLSASSPLRLVRSPDDPFTVNLAGTVSDTTTATAQGHVLSGIAIVVVSDSGEVATRIFDRNGLLKVSCAGVPDTCMSSDRSVLPSSDTVAPTSTASPTTASTTLHGLPLDTIPPGTYVFDGFLVPFTISTSAGWSGADSHVAARNLVLARSSPVAESIGIAVAPFGTASVQDALSSQCADGAVSLAPQPSTTLLGVTAQAVEGTVTVDCRTTVPAVGAQLQPNSVTAGSVMRVVAARVDGFLLIVVATAPQADWATFSKEVDATLASMTHT
ncbi:MAG: hypothetical protein JWL72_2804 [Ilumatobacteraceae bacterium]|nr:hypothetical protein [Ilumatobacteraceae bacterium]